MMIAHEEMLKEWNTLPPEDKQSVAAFIKTLHDKRRKPEQEPSTCIKNEPFYGMWSDRDDMKDSVEWVRKVREEEWGHQ